MTPQFSLKRLVIASVAASLVVASAARAASAGSDASPTLADGPVLSLTLDEAIAKTRAASARLASLTALTRSASEGVRGAEALSRPELDLAASYTRNSNVPELILAFPGQAPRTIFPNLPNAWRTHVGATMPVYTGGRIQAARDAASETERASVSDRAAATNDLAAETHLAYMSVLVARETARVLGEAIAAYDAHLKDARNRQELGLIASHETLAVTVERERAELARVQAKNAVGVAEANLRRLLGVPAETRLELAPPPEAAAVANETADLVRRATEGRPEVEALKARIRAAEAGSRIAGAATKPQAGVQAGFDYASPNPRILPLAGAWKDTWSVGLALSWKVLDGGKADAAVAQAAAQADALRAQLQDLESRIALEVSARRLDLDSALAGRAVAQRGIEAARDALRVARDRFREGVLTSSELLDAETRLLRAELEATQTEGQIQMAVAQLNRAVGR